MTDEGKLVQEIDRGRQAQELLEHELMQEAFKTIRETYLSQWEASPARDTEGRERIWTYLKQLEQLKAHLQSVLETGKMATQQRSIMERMKTGVRSLLD